MRPLLRLICSINVDCMVKINWILCNLMRNYMIMRKFVMKNLYNIFTLTFDSGLGKSKLNLGLLISNLYDFFPSSHHKRRCNRKLLAPTDFFVTNSMRSNGF